MAHILFVCRQNAGRSQMSQAFFDLTSPHRHVARSAGTEPAAAVHPSVVDAMQEVGVDLAGRRPKRLDEEMARWADIVITMGCGDACPVLPGKQYVEWELADPAGKPLSEVRRIRDEIRQRVAALIATLD